jgi:hypothetical protein
MDGLAIKHLLWQLQLAGPGADTHAFQQSQVELTVEPAVVVAAGRWNTALSLEVSKVLRPAPKPSCRFGDVDHANHRPKDEAWPNL